MATTTVTVYNHDIVGLYNRLNRFTMEMVKSVSSSVSQLNPYDRARLDSYLAALEGYLAWVVAQPQLDLPETTPKPWLLVVPEPAVTVENEEVDDVVRMLQLSREELTNSQSARLGSGMIPFDARRFSAVIEKLKNFLTNYVDNLTPLDLPESSPTDPISGPGSGGV